MVRIEHRMRQELAGTLVTGWNPAETFRDNRSIQRIHIQPMPSTQQHIKQLSNVSAGFALVNTDTDIAIREMAEIDAGMKNLTPRPSP
ncbi:hypothetical protein [Thiothrix subterranea]|uniref:hypothetical protein n=1 Tax=Thiothrix subterranea TaxID=2735563 RepID=UPI00280B3C4D|nr:hypothetical protein [Thiothrix subterranea]